VGRGVKIKVFSRKFPLITMRNKETCLCCLHCYSPQPTQLFSVLSLPRQLTFLLYSSSRECRRQNCICHIFRGGSFLEFICKSGAKDPDFTILQIPFVKCGCTPCSIYVFTNSVTSRCFMSFAFSGVERKTSSWL
jgi:hypothetical protein